MESKTEYKVQGRKVTKIDTTKHVLSDLELSILKDVVRDGYYERKGTEGYDECDMQELGAMSNLRLLRLCNIDPNDEEYILYPVDTEQLKDFLK